MALFSYPAIPIEDGGAPSTPPKYSLWWWTAWWWVGVVDCPWWCRRRVRAIRQSGKGRTGTSLRSKLLQTVGPFFSFLVFFFHLGLTP